jgi:CubicO group peptidase (beta-lactamase class C family)
MRHCKVLLAALALASSPAAIADEGEHLHLDTARVEHTLAGFVDDGRTVGASVLIWQDGRERHFSAAGLADREAGRPFARDTLVQIYSMTKPVTGVALMQLWEQGKFGLDDPLAWHLPQFANLQVYDESEPDKLRLPARPVTVRDVLRHTAGFSYGVSGHPSDPAWTALDPLSLENTLEQFADAMAQVPLLYDPGTHWHYSAGVDVQARLVEVLSGQPFAAYVREHIFLPLGMDEACWKCGDELLPASRRHTGRAPKADWSRSRTRNCTR